MTIDNNWGSASVDDGFARLLHAIRKHWLLGTIVAAAFFTTVVFYTIGQKRIFRASATVQIDPNPPKPLGKDFQAVVDMGSGNYWNNKEYYTTQQTILRGRAVAGETARILALHRDASFMANLPIGALPTTKPHEASLDDATLALMGRLTVEPVKDSRLVNVHVDDANPERARRILSTLVDTYLARNVDLSVASTAAATEWLHGQMETLKGELEKSELALHEYKKDKRILSVSLDDQSNMLRGEMQQLTEALTHVNTRREELAARVRELDRIESGDPTTLPANELLNSVILSNLRMDYAKAKGARDALIGAGKGDKYPEVEAANAQVESTREALMREVSNVREALRGDLAATTSQAKGLAGLFEQAKQRAMDLSMLEIEYRRLERTKANTEKLFGLVLERSKETDLTGMMRFNNITLSEQPVVGRMPVRPRLPVNLALGLVAGLLLGIVAAIGREWLDQTIRISDDIESIVRVPLLGVLPSLSGRASTSAYYSAYNRRSRHQGIKALSAGAGDVAPELIAHALPASNAAECARGIRTSLTLSSPDKAHKTIVVTSASPSEGKTTVATTIAIAFAQAGQRVVIMDCDLRRSRLHRVFKQKNASGVSSILQDPAGIEKAILTTDVPNLFLVPAGPHVPNPAEVLQSARFSNLLRELATRFDRVVIDSPPLLVVTDSAVLAAQTDATVLVIRAKKTKRDTAQRVVRKLVDLGVTVTGAVLNAIEEPKKKGSYYYGYYSRQGYGTSGETENSASPG